LAAGGGLSAGRLTGLRVLCACREPRPGAPIGGSSSSAAGGAAGVGAGARAGAEAGVWGVSDVGLRTETSAFSWQPTRHAPCSTACALRGYRTVGYSTDTSGAWYSSLTLGTGTDLFSRGWLGVVLERHTRPAVRRRAMAATVHVCTCVCARARSHGTCHLIERESHRC
jgi:hypothetical protein